MRFQIPSIVNMEPPIWSRNNDSFVSVLAIFIFHIFRSSSASFHMMRILRIRLIIQDFCGLIRYNIWNPVLLYFHICSLNIYHRSPVVCRQGLILETEYLYALSLRALSGTLTEYNFFLGFVLLFSLFFYVYGFTNNSSFTYRLN